MKHRALLALVLFYFFTMSLSAKPLTVGDTAPNVNAITETGASIALADVYAAQTYTLVYFYPKADTPGCTAQGCSLRDAYAELADKGVAVLGVSNDKPEAQLAFKKKFRLPFTLLADHDKVVIKAFGVPTVPLLGMAKRQAYLIKDGKIIWADYSASTAEQAADVLKAIAQ
jgi:thioredoxin-dependent peroxiredoxin